MINNALTKPVLVFTQPDELASVGQIPAHVGPVGAVNPCL